MKGGNWGLTTLRLCLGVFFIFMGLGKLGWFTSSAALRESLTTWAESAPTLAWVLMNDSPEPSACEPRPLACETRSLTPSTLLPM